MSKPKRPRGSTLPLPLSAMSVQEICKSRGSLTVAASTCWGPVVVPKVLDEHTCTLLFNHRTPDLRQHLTPKISAQNVTHYLGTDYLMNVSKASMPHGLLVCPQFPNKPNKMRVASVDERFYALLIFPLTEGPTHRHHEDCTCTPWPRLHGQRRLAQPRQLGS